MHKLEDEIIVYKPGTIVETIVGNVVAVLTGCTIRERGIAYEITYFVDKEYYTQWLSPCEFKVRSKNVQTSKIGFNNKE